MRDKLINAVFLGVAGGATGWQQSYNLMWALYGAPTRDLQYVGLFGSAVLLVAALSTFVRIRVADVLGAVGVILVWSAYLPAAWTMVRDVLKSPESLASEPVAYVPLILLSALTFRLYRHLKSAANIAKVATHAS
jgi:hypothetical protein